MSRRKRKRGSRGGSGAPPKNPAPSLPGVNKRYARMINSWMLNSVGVDMYRYHRPGGMDFGTLREVARKCEPVAAIVQTRQNQVAAFARKAQDDKNPGWAIHLKDRDKEPTARDKLRIKVAEKFFEKMHLPVHPEVSDRLERGRDFPEIGFEGLLRSWVRDRLTLDAVAGEKVRTSAGRLFTAWPVDAATIHRAYPHERKRDGEGGGQADISGELYALTWLKERPKLPEGDIAYVQMHEGRRVAGWPGKDFIYGYANPRTDVAAWGYGYSELEMLVGIATSILNAIAYNKSQFTVGALPPGLLVMTGAWDEEMLEAFKRSFENQLQGASQQNRLPILADPSNEGKGAQWLSFRGQNREMEYSLWMEFLVQIACAVYQIDPEEIGFKGVSGGQALFERSAAAELQQSKDKGLKPLLRFFEDLITREIVEELWDDLVFRFENIDPRDEAQEIELATKRLSGGLTLVNEERAAMDKDPIDAEWAEEAPLNPVAFQAYQGAKMEAQQAEMQEQEYPEQDPDEAQGPGRFFYEDEDAEGDGGPPPSEPREPDAGAVEKSMRAPVSADVLAASRFFGDWSDNG